MIFREDVLHKRKTCERIKGLSMPIYEFYCKKCDTIYNFFSWKVNTDKIPTCPKCRRVKLKRQVSIFSALSGRGEDAAGSDMPPIDESRLEKAMSMLAGEAGKINEDDPRQAAQLMRKLTQASGIRMGQGMEEALSRLERGEDPERIEAEMGDLLEGEDPFAFEARSGPSRKRGGPKKDDTLYDL